MLKHKLFIYFFIVLNLISCEEDIKIVFNEVNYTTSDNDIVNINIPFASGNQLISDYINSEIKNHIINTLKVGDSQPENLTIEASITAFNKEFKTFKSDFNDSTQIWEAQIDGEVIYQSSEIITLSISSYINTGGAHGNFHISILNFNANTGKKINNKDLFTNYDAFKNLSRLHFNKTIKKDITLFDPNTFILPKNIGYSETGIILLYNTYEIAPYSEGIIEFTIPYSEVNALLVLDRT
ncbi:DUF3298 and DUF4163 domain-containing protein [Gaetbulibacter saemankumensis]|uniref:DUF3298 and DUF4163 domain-containing protein n=1 Tax=Gaetbulibacter saemankumensis TaxID=311208 RepID=UPI0003FBA029|nr:DUF3298 and DUF4163 domain-containing protein [Gaetbulibacter saemankumensis]